MPDRHDVLPDDARYARIESDRADIDLPGWGSLRWDAATERWSFTYDQGFVAAHRDGIFPPGIDPRDHAVVQTLIIAGHVTLPFGTMRLAAWVDGRTTPPTREVDARFMSAKPPPPYARDGISVSVRCDVRDEGGRSKELAGILADPRIAVITRVRLRAARAVDVGDLARAIAHRIVVLELDRAEEPVAAALANARWPRLRRLGLVHVPDAQVVAGRFRGATGEASIGADLLDEQDVEASLDVIDARVRTAGKAMVNQLANAGLDAPSKALAARLRGKKALDLGKVLAVLESFDAPEGDLADELARLWLTVERASDLAKH